MGDSAVPQPPGDTRIESDGVAPVEPKSRTYSKRTFKVAGHARPASKSVTLDAVDASIIGGDDEAESFTLANMQNMEVSQTQRQLSALRKVHDDLRSRAETKNAQLKQLEQELSDLRRLNSYKESDSIRSHYGIGAVEKRYGATQLKLEDEMQNKEIFTHMIKRLTAELSECKNNVKATNTGLLATQAEHQNATLQLQKARQGQRSMETSLAALTRQAEARRHKQEEKLIEITKAVEQRVQQRLRQQEMEKKREAIAARAKGDLGTEEEDRLKRQFVVRSLYSSMLEQKVQKEAADLEKMEQGFQRIKSATGISDVQEIITKFKTKDETKRSLLHAESLTRERIEKLKEEKAEHMRQVEDIAATGVANGGNREMYQEVDHINQELNAARKIMNEHLARSTRLDLVLEEIRMSIRKFLSKINNSTVELPSIDALPEAIEDVDIKVARLMKTVTAALEEMSAGEEEDSSVNRGATSASHANGSSDEAKSGAGPFGHANAAKVNDMLFHNMMNVDPDMSNRNVRITPTVNLKQEASKGKANYSDGGALDDKGKEADDDSARLPGDAESEVLISAEVVKKLSDLITQREKQAKRTSTRRTSVEQ